MDRRPQEIRMLSEFLDGNRDEGAFRRFEEWLKQDDAHVRAFYEQLMIEEDIRQLSLIDDMSRYLECTKDGNRQRIVSSVPKPENRNSLFRSSKSIAFTAIAASLLVSSFLILWVKSGAEIEIADRSSAENHLPVESVVVATLGDTKDCRWGPEDGKVPTGYHFSAGSAVQLVSGIAQLTFETGAVLVLQGPCQLELAENAIELGFGRISAVVPQSASGFAVTTPSSKVVDLGTEFGVNVDELGSSQVHVFSGEVVTRARNRSGEIVGEPMFVTTSNAIHFHPDSEEAERFAADEQAFVRWLEGQDMPTVDLKPPVSGKLLLWLTAGNWILDDERLVNVWRDTLSDDNVIPHNALQANPDARPRVVEDVIGGLPAVRFDGIDDCLITTPMTSGDTQTLVFVASVRGTSHDQAQLINYNGPPQLVTIQKQNPNILQIVSRIDLEGYARVVPFVYLGFWDDQFMRVGNVKPSKEELWSLDPPKAGDPFIAVYKYDHDANHSELWLNGRSYGENTASVSISLTSRKVIGRHGGKPYYFDGDIAEVMIYDEGLDQERIDKLTNFLAEKFSIPISPQPD